MWWATPPRSLRRVVLLLPLVLTAAVLLIFPQPPPPPPLPPQQPPQLPLIDKDDVTVPSDNSQKNLDHEQIESGNSIVKDVIPLQKKEAKQLPKPWFMKDGEMWPEYNSDLHLFPEDAPGMDRITEQLMYTLPSKDEEKPIKTIYLANGLGSWQAAAERTEFTRNNCPVDRCRLTMNASEGDTADAVLFRDAHVNIRGPRPRNQIWIMYYLECPFHTISSPMLKHEYNWTATYRRDSDIVAPYERWVYHDPLVTGRKQTRNYAANKTKKVAWFVSNCNARNRRLQYARKLAKYISVDIYGSCGSLSCPRYDRGCFKMLNRDYKFYLAFENSNCRDYITEKFFVNGLQHDVIPIVMGARPEEYKAVAPHHSYIHVEEFAGPKELADYLHELDKNDELFNEYFKWKGTGEFINTYFFCRVCAMLHANEERQRTSHYTDIQEWWHKDTCTRLEWRSVTRDRNTDNG